MLAQSSTESKQSTVRIHEPLFLPDPDGNSGKHAFHIQGQTSNLNYSYRALSISRAREQP